MRLSSTVYDDIAEKHGQRLDNLESEKQYFFETKSSDLIYGNQAMR